MAMQTISHDRREFFVKGLLLAGAATLTVSGLGPLAAQAQTAPKPIRRSERYDDTFITERKPFKWPGNNTLAVWFIPNVEVWHYDSAVGVGITPNPTNYVPDVFNYAWREYGMRVGLWRMADVLRRRRRQSDRRLELAGLRSPSQGDRGNEEARLGVYGPRHHQLDEPRRPQSRAGTRHHPRHPEDDRAGDRQAAARLARLRTDRDPLVVWACAGPVNETAIAIAIA